MRLGITLLCLGLLACQGEIGPMGPQGSSGPPGPQGEVGQAGESGTGKTVLTVDVTASTYGTDFFYFQNSAFRTTSVVTLYLMPDNVPGSVLWGFPETFWVKEGELSFYDPDRRFLGETLLIIVIN